MAAIVEPVATVARPQPRPRVEHPRLQPWEYAGLQAEAGWCLPVELIEGEAVMMSPIGDAASAVQIELIAALREWQRRVGDEGVLREDVFVAFAPDEHLAPDICWWGAGRRPPVVRREVDVVPDLVVEVLSPSTRANDLGPKRDVYMRTGVRELWLADPEARTLTRVLPRSEERLMGAGDPGRPADVDHRTAGVGDRPTGAGDRTAGPGDETLGDETLRDETLADETLADETLRDETLADETLGDETLGVGDVLRSELLDGFELALARVF